MTVSMMPGNNLKFGMLLLRYANNNATDFSQIPDRDLSIATHSRELNVDEPLPSMDFNKGDIVLLTPDRETLIKLVEDHPDVERMTDKLTQPDVWIDKQDVCDIVGKIVTPENEISLLNILIKKGLSEEEANMVLDTLEDTPINREDSRTHFQRVV